MSTANNQTTKKAPSANNQTTKKAPSANNPTTKKAPLIVKDSEKAQVLTKYRDYYRYLHGKYEGKYNETNRNIKWQKLLEYSQTLDGFKDKLSTPEELKDKIDNWKKAMNKKEKKELKTGSAPTESWTESEKILWNIKHQHDSHLNKVKVHFTVLLLAIPVAFSSFTCCNIRSILCCILPFSSCVIVSRVLLFLLS